eukprot:30891-Pelagococcus_subviridis.AAC.2
MSGWSSKASVGVQRRRGWGLKARDERRETPGKCIERTSRRRLRRLQPRRRVGNLPGHLRREDAAVGERQDDDAVDVRGRDRGREVDDDVAVDADASRLLHRGEPLLFNSPRASFARRAHRARAVRVVHERALRLVFDDHHEVAARRHLRHAVRIDLRGRADVVDPGRVRDDDVRRRIKRLRRLRFFRFFALLGRRLLLLHRVAVLVELGLGRRRREEVRVRLRPPRAVVVRPDPLVRARGAPRDVAVAVQHLHGAVGEIPRHRANGEHRARRLRHARRARRAVHGRVGRGPRGGRARGRDHLLEHRAFRRHADAQPARGGVLHLHRARRRRGRRRRLRRGDRVTVLVQLRRFRCFRRFRLRRRDRVAVLVELRLRRRRRRVIRDATHDDARARLVGERHLERVASQAQRDAPRDDRGRAGGVERHDRAASGVLPSLADWRRARGLLRGVRYGREEIRDEVPLDGILRVIRRNRGELRRELRREVRRLGQLRVGHDAIRGALDVVVALLRDLRGLAPVFLVEVLPRLLRDAPRLRG